MSKDHKGKDASSKDKAPSKDVRDQNKGKESGREAAKTMRGIVDSVRHRTN